MCQSPCLKDNDDARTRSDQKSTGLGGTAQKDISLLFIDLARVFDKVPHDLLWNTYVTVMVNGWPTQNVIIKNGVKQGCPLSPLLWALFISDIGLLLEQSTGGIIILIQGQRINVLLFVDDLVIIGRCREDVERAINCCQYQFKLSVLDINY